MNLKDHVLYGSLMSMKSEYLMRAYSKALEVNRRYEVTDYTEVEHCFEVTFFDNCWEEYDSAYQFSRTLERSHIADYIMKTL